MTHTCHANGCSVVVPPRMFMCRRHWSALPKAVQRAIWREYRPGQERDKAPTARYMAVQQLANALVAFRPHDEHAAAVAGGYIVRAAMFRTLAMDDGGRDPLRGLIPDGLSVPDLTVERARELLVEESRSLPV